MAAVRLSEAMAAVAKGYRDFLRIPGSHSIDLDRIMECQALVFENLAAVYRAYEEDNREPSSP
jgi:hypothetical protein